jgi:hypothetical protein
MNILSTCKKRNRLNSLIISGYEDLVCFRAPQVRLELLFYSAYSQFIAKNQIRQVSKNTPLCLHLFYKVKYNFNFIIGLASFAKILRSFQIPIFYLF